MASKGKRSSTAVVLVIFVMCFIEQGFAVLNNSSSTTRLLPKSCKVKVNPLDGEHFRELIRTEKQVDVVHFHLKWKNTNFTLDYYAANSVFDYNDWVWATKSSGKALLTLPIGMSIYSSGTFSVTTYHMDVEIYFEPEECSGATISRDEMYVLVALALQQNITYGFDEAVLCHHELRNLSSAKLIAANACNDLNKNNILFTVLETGPLTKVAPYIYVIYAFATLLSIFFLFYFPKLYCHGPFHDGTKKHLMHLNEAPLRIGRSWPRGRRFIFTFLLLPGPTVFLALLYYYKLKEHPILRIVIPEIITNPLLVIMLDPERFIPLCEKLYFTGIIVLLILICIPEDAQMMYKNMDTCSCAVCTIIKKLSITYGVNAAKIYDYNSFEGEHFKRYFRKGFWRSVKSVVKTGPFSGCCYDLLEPRSWLFLFIFPFHIIFIGLGIIASFTAMIFQVPISIFELILFKLFERIKRKRFTFIFDTFRGSFIFISYTIPWACFMLCVVQCFTNFVEIFLLLAFTLMGLGANFIILGPKLVLGISMIYYTFTYFRQFYGRYSHLQFLLFQECQCHDNNSECNERPKLVSVGESGCQAIPRDLFNKVRQEVMPIWFNTITLFLKIIGILLLFIFFAECAIAFGKFKDMSSLSETFIAVAGSAIPKLIGIFASSSNREKNDAVLRQKISHMISIYALEANDSDLENAQSQDPLAFELDTISSDEPQSDQDFVESPNPSTSRSATLII